MRDELQTRDVTPETLRKAGGFSLNISYVVNNSAVKEKTLKRLNEIYLGWN